MPDRSKISSFTMLVLFLLAICFILFFYLGNVMPGTEGTPVEEPMITDEFLTLTYVYFGIALFAVFAFSLFELLKSPKAAKGILIAIGFVVAVFVLSYLWASGNLIPGFTHPSNIKPTLKLVDTGLKAAYVFGTLAITGVIYTEISGMLKSK